MKSLNKKMAQFDNPKSITMLFTGAFLVSLGVIAFLNIEMQSRSNHGTKIKNENVFEVLGKKISQFFSTLRERNSYRRSILYHLLISENSTRAPTRKLQYFLEDSNSVDDAVEHNYNRTYHRLRHEKKIRRLTELRLKQKSNSSSQEVTFPSKFNENSRNASSFSSFVTNLTNGSVQRFKFSVNATNNDTSKDIVKEKLGAHQNCYTTNDVLEIIAITCLVNFIFWFMIISCVNIFTRNQKMWKSESCESLTSIGSGSDEEPHQRRTKTRRQFDQRDPVCRHNVVQDFVSSLKPVGKGEEENEEEEEREEEEEEEEDRETQRSELIDKSNVLRSSSSDKRTNVERWKHRRFIRLPSILFDIISLDNIKQINEKKFLSRDKSKKIVNSLSMEDLIF